MRRRQAKRETENETEIESEKLFQADRIKKRTKHRGQTVSEIDDLSMGELVEKRAKKINRNEMKKRKRYRIKCCYVSLKLYKI